MTIENLNCIKNDIALEPKLDVAPIWKDNSLARSNIVKRSIRLIWINAVRQIARKSENERLLRGMPLPRPGQRPKYCCLNPARFPVQRGSKATHKGRGSLHGTDGVRRRWSYADLEQVAYPNGQLDRHAVRTRG